MHGDGVYTQVKGTGAERCTGAREGAGRGLGDGVRVKGTGAERDNGARACTGRCRDRDGFSLDGDRSLHGPCSRTRRSPCRKKVPLRYCCDVYNSCACSVGFCVPGLTLFQDSNFSINRKGGE